MVSSSAARAEGFDRIPSSQPRTADPARNTTSATTTIPYLADRCTSAAISATSNATVITAVIPAGFSSAATRGKRQRTAIPAASGKATTRARLTMMSAGRTPAPPDPAKSRKTGPATSTVVTVDPMSTPADSAASPSAIAVVATDAISQGASPTVSSPSRSAPDGTICATAHDNAGSTVTPTSRAAASDRHATAIRPSAAGSIVSAVAKTSTASRTLIPWWLASHASGDCTSSPITAATSTVVSSGYPAMSDCTRDAIERLLKRRRGGTATLPLARKALLCRERLRARGRPDY